MRRLALLLLTAPAALLLLGACASGSPLVDERLSEPFAGWLRAGVGLERRPFTVDWVNGPGTAPARLAGAYLSRPGAAQGPVIVLQPGILADRDTFRFLAPLLARQHDVWLVDPPGTGASSRPVPEEHGPPVYTPTWLGRSTLRALERHQRSWMGRRDLVLVGHSLGSSALVRALTDPATCRELPALCDRVTHVVLLTYPDVTSRDIPPTLETIATLSRLEADVGGALGILDARVEDGIRSGVVDPERRALRREADRFTDLLTDASTRRPAQAMLARFRPRRPSGEADWEAARALQGREATLARPVLVVWGAQDDTLPLAMAPVVTQRLPSARLRVIQDAKHSPHQERADRVAQLIQAFVAATPATAGAPRRPRTRPASPAGVPRGTLPAPIIRRSRRAP